MASFPVFNIISYLILLDEIFMKTTIPGLYIINRTVDRDNDNDFLFFAVSTLTSIE